MRKTFRLLLLFPCMALSCLAQDSAACRKSGLEKEIIVYSVPGNPPRDSIVRYFNLNGIIDSAFGYGSDAKLRNKRFTLRDEKRRPVYDLWWEPDQKSARTYYTTYYTDGSKNQNWEINLLGDTVYHAYYYYFGPAQALPLRAQNDLHGQFLHRIRPEDSVIFLRWISYSMIDHHADSSFCLTIISHAGSLRTVDEYHTNSKGRLNSHYTTAYDRKGETVMRKDSSEGYHLLRKTVYDELDREVSEYENYDGAITVTKCQYLVNKNRDSLQVTFTKCKKNRQLFYHDKTKTIVLFDRSGNYEEEKTFSGKKFLSVRKFSNDKLVEQLTFSNGKDTLSRDDYRYTAGGFELETHRYEREDRDDGNKGPLRLTETEKHYYYFRKK